MSTSLDGGATIKAALELGKNGSKKGTLALGLEPEVDVDIVIPVYNEGKNILRVLGSFEREVKSRLRVLICYDRDDDDTLVALAGYHPGFEIRPVKNRGKGPFGAVMSGFEASTAPSVLVYPADDDFNATQIDAMVEKRRHGADIVAASRFIPGGCMEGCPWLKASLVRSSAFALYHVARLPTHDPSNGLRLFSRRVIDSIPVESSVGFTYSIELLVKAHRLGWPVAEVPAKWFERKEGQSRFKVLKWLPAYLTWFRYAFETTYLDRGPGTVRLKEEARGS